MLSSGYAETCKYVPQMTLSTVVLLSKSGLLIFSSICLAESKHQKPRCGLYVTSDIIYVHQLDITRTPTIALLYLLNTSMSWCGLIPNTADHFKDLYIAGVSVTLNSGTRDFLFCYLKCCMFISPRKQCYHIYENVYCALTSVYQFINIYMHVYVYTHIAHFFQNKENKSGVSMQQKSYF